MTASALERGSIVQIPPTCTTVREEFRGRLLVVTEVRPWGVVAYATNVEPNIGETAYYVRLAKGEYIDTGGMAVYMLQ